MYKFGGQGRGVGWTPYIEIIYSLYYTVTYLSLMRKIFIANGR